jgi:hypothetical protein
MARTFTVSTVLRMVPNSLLKTFFQRMKHRDLGIKWERIGERDIQPILAALGELSQKQYDAIEAALHSIFDLACETGIDAVLEAGQLWGEPNLPAQLPADGGPYHKAMWVWLNQPEVFDKAIRLHRADSLVWWRKRDDLPKKKPKQSTAALQQLEQELSNLFQSKQGRGKECTVEVVTRGQTVYYFGYPDDYVQNVTAHDEHGKLAPRTFRQTFNVVFAYDRADGTLELFAKVTPRLKEDLEKLFARIILDHELVEWNPDAVYELNHLKDRNFALATDAADGARARIRRMRLSLMNSNRRIILEADPDHRPDDIYDMLEHCLNKNRVPVSAVNLTLVTLGFEFEAVDGRKPGSMTFNVAYPDSCNLRNQRPERIELVQKYLKRWKIDRVESTAHHPAKAGS